MNISLRAFRQKAKRNRSVFRKYLGKLEKLPPRGLDNKISLLEPEVWNDTNCLSCGNCCKTMTPTYTVTDIRRIANHLQMSVPAFKQRWLRKEKGTGDWLNKSTPCQFFNMIDNKCSIYAVRPADCAGFPHLSKKKMVEYIHVHKQNIETCPATYRMVEKMMMLLTG